MNLVFAEFLNYLLIGVECIIYILFAETFFSIRNQRWQTICIWCVALLLEYPLLHIVNTLNIKPLVMIMFFTLIIILGYNAKWLSAVFCSAASLAVSYLFDILVVMIFSAATKNPFEILVQQPELYVALSFISKFSAIFLSVLVRALAQNLLLGNKQHWTYHLSCCIYPAAVLVCGICLFLVVQQSPEVSNLLLGCMLFLLFIDIGSIFLLGYLETQREKLTQSILLQKELDSALTNLSAARQSYENERKLTHDFQNQMAVLQGILEKNDTNQDALTYLHQVFHYAGSESLSVTTNRIAVDVLLDLKYQMAKKQNIQFHVRLDDLSSFPVPDNALVVLLSNLLDNAIEACMKLPKESERIIIVKMKVNPEECILYVKNTAMIPQNQNGSLPKTTKPDTVQHGFGFKNIISIVNQYNGMYAINQDNGWFAFAASFPFVLC
jgi:hypothetical protein